MISLLIKDLLIKKAVFQFKYFSSKKIILLFEVIPLPSFQVISFPLRVIQNLSRIIVSKSFNLKTKLSTKNLLKTEQLLTKNLLMRTRTGLETKKAPLRWLFRCVFTRAQRFQTNIGEAFVCARSLTCNFIISEKILQYLERKLCFS